MNQNKPAVVKKLQERFRNVSVGRGLYIAFVMPTMLSMFSTRAFAADTIWTKASAIMQDVYTQILSISTIAAVVTAAVALLLMNFSRSGRTVDESRAWLKRIIITWAILNSRVYKNANMVLLGTSGAGKTFTLQLIALRMRRKSTQVFIIAPLKGHEFLRACNNIGGEFISISPASKQCINVCEIRKQDLSANQLIDGVVNENSILAKKIQQLHIFFSLLIPDINHEERQLLDEALIRTYAKKGITHNNESLIDPDHPDRYREMPLLGDVYEILMESPETKRMGNILNRLVNGSAKTFNQHTNVQLDNLYTVLDISELTGELLPVGMFVALDYVWDRLHPRGRGYPQSCGSWFP